MHSPRTRLVSAPGITIRQSQCEHPDCGWWTSFPTLYVPTIGHVCQGCVTSLPSRLLTSALDHLQRAVAA